jgi:tetratricopeptide (TPR) repeat protein
MPAQPATRTAELLLKINGLSSRDRSNTLLLKGLERQARQVLAAGDLAGGYTLLGALAAMQQDIAELRTNHDKALKAAPHDANVLRNYAISLVKAGAMEDASSMASRAWEHDKSSLQNLLLLVRLTVSMGRMQEAASLLREVLKLTQRDTLPPNYSRDIVELQEAASLLAEHGISDRAVSAIACAALQVAPPLSVAGTLSRVTEDDETKWIDFALALEESVERVTELNQKLAERMAELSLDREICRASSAFVVRFTSKSTTDASSPH